jgi:hypothetical protein
MTAKDKLTKAKEAYAVGETKTDTLLQKFAAMPYSFAISIGVVLLIIILILAT